jgi:insecticidal toxin complex protein TccC
VTRSRLDDAGRLLTQADPRLGTLDTPLANLTVISSPAGAPLRTLSVDAGRHIVLADAEGRPCRQQDAPGTLTAWLYETYDPTADIVLPGRLLAVQEQVTGATAVRTTQRLIYADRSGTVPEENRARNRCGTVVRHYDTAGLATAGRYALSGTLLQQSRTLLPDTADDADWAGEEEAAWRAQLEPGDEACHVTRSTVNATGEILTQTGAAGHMQRMAYDVAGRLSAGWLTLKGGAEQPVLVSRTFSAAGQTLQEVHGNGVTTDYAYEPGTQRLTGITVTRAATGTVSAAVLQALRYGYDPAGNVLTVRDDAQETTFWRNQKVDPESTYTYDSLYRLVSATGRENAGAGQQGQALPALITPVPADDSRYTTYTRTYAYDAGGNLTQIRHSAPATGNRYTTTLTVSDRSNRAVLSGLTADPAQVDGYFDAAGHQLNPGFSVTGNLVWDPRGNLQGVTTVGRATEPDAGATTNDGERYRYDGQSQRLRKVSVQQAGGIIRTQRVTYLPGLELRTMTTGDTTTGALQVITAGVAGRAQVRVLHWESGRPDGVDNDQLRYSVDGLTGSSGLELDATGQVISREEYYPYGGTAVWAARSNIGANYKTVRYSGKERDATGLYYYGYRYYQPWAGRWLSADPAGTVDGLNLYRMVRNNPVMLKDIKGLAPLKYVNSRSATPNNPNAGLKSTLNCAACSAAGVVNLLSNPSGHYETSSSEAERFYFKEKTGISLDEMSDNDFEEDKFNDVLESMHRMGDNIDEQFHYIHAFIKSKVDVCQDDIMKDLTLKDASNVMMSASGHVFLILANGFVSGRQTIHFLNAIKQKNGNESEIVYVDFQGNRSGGQTRRGTSYPGYPGNEQIATNNSPFVSVIAQELYSSTMEEEVTELKYSPETEQGVFDPESLKMTVMSFIKRTGANGMNTPTALLSKPNVC